MTRTNALTKAILSLLKLHGYFAWRNQAGSVLSGSYRINLGTPGVADIIAFGHGLWLAIEVKQGRDKLNPAQLTFKAAWDANRGIHIEARSVDDVLAVIQPQQRKAA